MANELILIAEDNSKELKLVRGPAAGQEPVVTTMKLPAARILVIDDDRAVVRLLVVRLGEDDYMVRSAMTSEEGLELVTSFHPDLVLLDVSLPDLRVLKCSNESARSIPPSRSLW
jgi:PleD family two-component response regulator